MVPHSWYWPWPRSSVLATPSRVAAQAVTGTLLGNVTDSSGGAVPGATVTATEVQTNVSRTAISNESGYYIFSSLQNGTFEVVSRAPGLQESRAAGGQSRCEHDGPRRSRARSRTDDGGGHRFRRIAAPADGPHRYGASDRIEDGGRVAVDLQPQLPVVTGHRARIDPSPPRAFGLLQLAGFAGCRNQRSAAHGQQHADRRPRQQPQDGPPAGHHSRR